MADKYTTAKKGKRPSQKGKGQRVTTMPVKRTRSR